MTMKEFAEKSISIIKNLYCIAHSEEECWLFDEAIEQVDELVTESEQERTEFDKWKENLTVEEFYILYSIDDTCQQCPLFDAKLFVCKGSHEQTCLDNITEWANKRSENE